MGNGNKQEVKIELVKSLLTLEIELFKSSLGTDIGGIWIMSGIRNRMKGVRMGIPKGV